MTATGYGTAATPNLAPVAPVDQHSRRVFRRPESGSISRWVILAVAAIYFFVPLVAAISFTLKGTHGGITFSAYKDIFTASATGQVGFSTALVYSLELSAVTIVLTLALMVPTQLMLHLRFTKVRPLVEIITLLPLVFPPIVLVVGVNDTFQQIHEHTLLYSVVSWIRDANHPLLLPLLYVMLAMPFTFRTLDAGIRAIDARTLVEASRNLGAGWLTVMFRVLLPCLRTAVINSAFLCFALVMGEFTLSSILNYAKPFPVWLYQLPTQSGAVRAAVSVFSLILVEALLLVIGLLNVRRATDKKG
jgi:putative spermidine/putrescine transport system permease protein